MEDERSQRQCAQFQLGYSIWNGLFEQHYEAPLLVTRELRHESADRRTVCPPRVGGGSTRVVCLPSLGDGCTPFG